MTAFRRIQVLALCATALAAILVFGGPAASSVLPTGHGCDELHCVASHAGFQCEDYGDFVCSFCPGGTIWACNPESCDEDEVGFVCWDWPE